MLSNMNASQLSRPTETQIPNPHLDLLLLNGGGTQPTQDIILHENPT